MRKATGLPDAVICASGLLNGRPINICAIELKFIGGSMGAVVGEKITRQFERGVGTERGGLIGPVAVRQAAQQLGAGGAVFLGRHLRGELGTRWMCRGRRRPR